MKIIYQAPDGYTIRADIENGMAYIMGPTRKTARVQLLPHAPVAATTAAQLRKMKLDPANYRQIGSQVLRIAAIEAWDAALAEHQAHLAAQKAAADAKAAQKAQNVPGLDALNRAATDFERAWDANRRDIARGEGPFTDTRPAEARLDALTAEFPRAAAYRRAEAYSLAHNDRKATAGHKAMNLLIAGGEIEAADAILEGWLDGVDVD